MPGAALGEEGTAWVKVWTGTGHICLGTLWLHRVGVREDSWRGCWEQDVVTQGANCRQLVCSGRWGWSLAGPLALLRTPGRSGPAGCWLSSCKRHFVLGNGPGPRGRQGSSRLVAEQPVTACSSPHCSFRVCSVIYPESQCVGRNGSLHGGHSFESGCGGEKACRCARAASLVRAGALAPSSPAPQGRLRTPSPGRTGVAWTCHPEAEARSAGEGACG